VSVSIDFDLFFHLLNGTAGPAELQPDLFRLLFLKGVVITLREDQSPDAVSLLEKTVLLCPLAPIQEQALQSLVELAMERNPESIQAIYRLAIEQNLVTAQLAIEQSGITIPDLQSRAVYALLVGKLDLFRDIDPGLELLTNYYLSAEPAVQHVILDAAKNADMKNWIQIVQAIREGSF
jgi:hypothetical protein